MYQCDPPHRVGTSKIGSAGKFGARTKEQCPSPSLERPLPVGGSNAGPATHDTHNRHSIDIRLSCPRGTPKKSVKRGTYFLRPQLLRPCRRLPLWTQGQTRQ